MTEDARRRPASALLRILAGIEDAVLALILSLMIALAALQIVLRNLFDSGLAWADPMLRVSVLWVGMVGAMVATRDDRQISVDALSRFLPRRWVPRLRIVTDFFTSAVALYLGWHALRLVLEDRSAGIVAFASVPVWLCEAVLPIAATVIGLRYAVYGCRHVAEALRRRPEVER